MKTKMILMIFGISLFFSCTSAKFEGEATLSGKVYDEKGRPVSNYYIYTDRGDAAVSDCNGNFLISNVTSGEYKIYGGSYGWCGSEMTFHFNDRKNILCIQAKSLDSLLPELSALIYEEKFKEAGEILEKSRRFNKKNPFFQAFDCLLEYSAEPDEKKREKLISAIEYIGEEKYD